MAETNKVITKDQKDKFEYWANQCYDLTPNGRDWSKTGYEWIKKYGETL